MEWKRVRHGVGLPSLLPPAPLSSAHLHAARLGGDAADGRQLAPHRLHGLADDALLAQPQPARDALPGAQRLALRRAGPGSRRKGGRGGVSHAGAL